MVTNSQKCSFCRNSSEEGCWALIRLDKNIGRTEDCESPPEEGIRYEDCQITSVKPGIIRSVTYKVDLYRFAISEISVPRCAACEQSHKNYGKKVNLLRLIFSMAIAFLLVMFYLGLAYPRANWIDKLFDSGVTELVIGIVATLVLYFLPFFRILSNAILRLIKINSIYMAKNYPPVQEKLKQGFLINSQVSS